MDEKPKISPRLPPLFQHIINLDRQWALLKQETVLPYETMKELRRQLFDSRRAAEQILFKRDKA